ncbi:MAG: NAD(P)H-hydrate dehydratase [Eubacteriales bacterium]
MKLGDVFLSASSIKEAEGRASFSGVSQMTLMENAARETISALTKKKVSLTGVAIICGRGRNGGYGYSLACALVWQGINVSVVHVSPPKNEDSFKYMESFVAAGGRLRRYSDDPDEAADIITNAALVVDALHGMAYSGEIRGEELYLVELANASGGFILALDLPTGVYAEGRVSPNCVMADMTITYTSHKAATLVTPASEYCGEVIVADIGVPDEITRVLRPEGFVIGEEVLLTLPQREDCSNKSTFGTLLAVVGSPNMPGAAYLASLGALRSGVGLLKLSSDAETLSVLKNRLSEPVFLNFSKDMAIEHKPSALLVGCGIGRGYDGVLDELFKGQKQTTIIDADGINYLAQHINVLMEMQGDVILTPHPGEMARLMGEDIEYISKNRIECAKAFAMEFSLVLVLKGYHTVIASPDGGVYVNTTGDSSLAKGGSGDVLAGVIASLAAQGVPPLKAACAGVYAHGKAADNLKTKYGARGLLPHDLPAEIGRILG